MQEIANEKKKYIAKVEVILTEQRDLRSKDQTLFKQVCQARDKLNE